jgi:zinc transport system permease protein
MFEFLKYDFFVRGLMAGSFLAVATALIGSFLVVKRFSQIADTLSHMALLGVAIAVITSTSPTLVTILVTLLASLFIEYLRTSKSISAESLLAMLLPAGLSLSLLLLSLFSKSSFTINSFLFGSAATVSQAEVWLSISLSILVIFVICSLYRQLLFVSFDEEAAFVSGLPVKLLNITILSLSSILISLGIKIVGVLLISALTIIPVLASHLVARSFKSSVIVSTLISVASVIIGLIISFYLDLPAGPSTVAISLVFFFAALVFKG